MDCIQSNILIGNYQQWLLVTINKWFFKIIDRNEVPSVRVLSNLFALCNSLTFIVFLISSCFILFSRFYRRVISLFSLRIYLGTFTQFYSFPGKFSIGKFVGPETLKTGGTHTQICALILTHKSRLLFGQKVLCVCMFEFLTDVHCNLPPSFW